MKRTSIFILLALFVGAFQMNAQNTIRLNAGQTLAKGQKIEVDGKGFLLLQNDGSLAAYNSSNQLKWETFTNGKTVTHVMMQFDGNLVIANNSNVVWSSNSSTVGAAGGYFQINLDNWQVGIYSNSNYLLKELSPAQPTSTGSTSPLTTSVTTQWSHVQAQPTTTSSSTASSTPTSTTSTTSTTPTSAPASAQTTAQVKFTHGAGFVANWQITYTQPGKPVTTINQTGTTLGWKNTYTIPGDASNIRVLVQGATGLLWEPWRTTYDKTFPTPPSGLCIKIFGTTLDQKWNSDCN